MFVVVLLLLKMISCNCNMVIQDYDLNVGVWDQDPKEAHRDCNLFLQNIQAIKEDCDLSVKIKFTQGSIFDQVKNFANGPRKQDLQSESHCQ